MENSKKVVVSVLIVAVVVVLIVVAMMIFGKKNKQEVPVSNPQSISTEEKASIKKEAEETEDVSFTPLTEEKKAELAVIANVSGKVLSVSAENVKLSTTEGEKTLKVPEEGASFVSQTKQENGSIMIEEIGVLKVPVNAEVDVQYNSATNEIMLLAVK